MAKNRDYRGISTQYEASVVLLKKWVDFYWEVNGKTYEFSIPGGGFASLEHLVEALGIATTEENTAISSADTANAAYEVININDIEVSEATKTFVEGVSNGFSNGSFTGGTSNSNNQFYLARIESNTNVKIHYGYLDDNGSYVEWTDRQEMLRKPNMLGDQYDVRVEIDGYEYITTRLSSSTGHDIIHLLQTEQDKQDGGNVPIPYDNNKTAEWRFREATKNNAIYPSWSGIAYDYRLDDNLLGNKDIYVVYRKNKKNPETPGGEGSDDLDTPQIAKEKQDNGDGTYDIDLSVTTSSEASSHSGRANVVIVLDTSGSINESASSGGTKWNLVTSSIKNLTNELLGLNTDSGADARRVEFALVNFSNYVKNTLSFGTVQFTRTGTYTYTITEYDNSANMPYVLFADPIEVTITVSSDENGRLQVESVSDNSGIEDNSIVVSAAADGSSLGSVITTMTNRSRAINLEKIDSVTGKRVEGAVFELRSGRERLYFDSSMRILTEAQVLDQIGETSINSETAIAKMQNLGITSSFTMGQKSLRGFSFTGYTLSDGEFVEDAPTVYQLVETSAPSGYVITAESNYFKVVGIRDETETKRVRYTGMEIRLTDKNGNDIVDESGEKKLVYKNATVSEQSLQITITNEPGVALPSTGGSGTDLFYLFGTLLTGLAGAGLVMKRRRRNVA